MARILTSSTVQADSTGRAVAYIGPGGAWGRWEVQQLSLRGPDTSHPEASVYLDHIAPEAFHAGTFSGHRDTATGAPITLTGANQLIIAWTKATPGGYYSVTAYGQVIP